MDVDFLTLSPDAQMDLMNTIYIEKLAQFSESHTPVLPPPPPSPLPLTPVADFPYFPNFESGTPSHESSMAAMREVIFRMAAMQPVNIDPESVRAPKRRNVRISKDPQSVAARLRRERISERIRILQRLVPGGTKMDTASMLDEAIHYVKFLKTQVQSLERASAENRTAGAGLGLGLGFPFQMLR